MLSDIDPVRQDLRLMVVPDAVKFPGDQVEVLHIGGFPERSATVTGFLLDSDQIRCFGVVHLLKISEIPNTKHLSFGAYPVDK